MFALALCVGHAHAQDEDPANSGSLSRAMKTAIRYYENGEDMQAMDRFMDILTKGDPTERSMANEYINLITHRMNAGGTDFKAPPKPAMPVAEVDAPPVKRAPEAPRVVEAAVAAVAAPQVVVEAENVALAQSARSVRPLPTAPVAPRAQTRSDAPLPTANKALMKKEIKAKIRSALEKSLRELKAVEDLRVVMQENGDPRAIGIPSPLLFSSGIAFQKTAGKLLDSLTRLVYSLGSTKVMILPEGAAIGDAKVLDMRRTMGVSAHLYSAGIAPPRVKVNLLNSQVEIPKALQDFKGVVILFVYNEPLGLVVESALGDEAGPPLSLGVYPPSFRPDRNEGVIIELSVSDPPAGLVSWKFQLLQPSPANGGDLAPLQEVVGGGPVFHQIYWNGRQNYFGPLLPAGRYECVLTATDTKNRQRTLHKWIQLLEDGTVAAASAPAPAAAASQPAAAAAEEAPAPAKGRKAPSADLDGGMKADALVREAPAKVKGVEIGGKKAKRGGKKAKVEKVEAEDAPEPAPRKSASAAAASVEPAVSPAAKPAKPASGNYELLFNKSSHQLAPEGEKMLSKVAETVSYYPLENLKLIGYAVPSEPDAAALAERRAQMVAGLLINKYQVEPKKIQVSSKVAEDQAAKVEVYFVGNE